MCFPLCTNFPPNATISIPGMNISFPLHLSSLPLFTLPCLPSSHPSIQLIISLQIFLSWFSSFYPSFPPCPASAYSHFILSSLPPSLPTSLSLPLSLLTPLSQVTKPDSGNPLIVPPSSPHYPAIGERQGRGRGEEGYTEGGCGKDNY